MSFELLYTYHEQYFFVHIHVLPLPVEISRN